MDNAKIFVANLSKDITMIDFNNKFNIFGKIVSSNIIQNKNINSLNYGFVSYDDSKSANEAVTKMNGINFFGNILNVKISNRTKQKKVDIYIKHLPKTITKKELHNIFEKYGPIISSIILKTNGKPNGCALIKYMNPDSANKAIKDMTGNKIFVNYAIDKNDKNNKVKYSLYIGNLPDDVDIVKLRNLFERCGNIYSINVINNYGFVTYTDKKIAENAIKELNDSVFDGNKINVSFSKKKTKKQVNMPEYINEESLNNVIISEGPMAYNTPYHKNNFLEKSL